MLKNTEGFTLIELLIALVIGSFLILGITGTYSALQSSIQTSKELENAQEVLRFTSNVFTRSLKQTSVVPIVNNINRTLTVQQNANARSCLGTQPNVNYVEVFTFVQPNLSCQITDTAGNQLNADTTLLTGITNMQFNTNALGGLVIINVVPNNLAANFGGNIQIDIALTSIIIP